MHAFTFTHMYVCTKSTTILYCIPLYRIVCCVVVLYVEIIQTSDQSQSLLFGIFVCHLKLFFFFRCVVLYVCFLLFLCCCFFFFFFCRILYFNFSFNFLLFFVLSLFHLKCCNHFGCVFFYGTIFYCYED